MTHLRSLLPRSLRGRALVVTILYALLALFVLHAPVSRDGPFARLFGGPDPARDAAVSFVQWLFWPLVAVLFIAACEPSLRRVLKRLDPRE